VSAVADSCQVVEGSEITTVLAMISPVRD